jgi:hypothetical protein
MRSAGCDAYNQLIPRANFDKLKEVFHYYASVERNGKHFMTDRDFVQR